MSGQMRDTRLSGEVTSLSEEVLLSSKLELIDNRYSGCNTLVRGYENRRLCEGFGRKPSMKECRCKYCAYSFVPM